MAIFGVGSKWEKKELKTEFFKYGIYRIGWNEQQAEDLYVFLAALKVGDILYLKTNRPGSRDIRVKGIGIVTKNLSSSIKDCISDQPSTPLVSKPHVRVAWLHQSEFKIRIPGAVGKMTNLRAATAYEELLPLVQEQIIDKLIGKS